MSTGDRVKPHRASEVVHPSAGVDRWEMPTERIAVHVVS